MRTQYVTGPTIQAALKEARRQFGDDVVLIESRPAEDDQPARITVMADTPLPASKQPVTPSGPARPAPSEEPAPQLAGYAPRMRRSAAAGSEGSAETTGETPSSSRTAVAVQTATNGPGETGANGGRNQPASEPRNELGRKKLFPSLSAYGDGASDAEASHDDDAARHQLEDQLKLLNNRLDTMERRFGGAVIGSTQQWMANPLFTELLEKGLRPSTLNSIFERLVNRGFEPDDDPEDLRWAVAQELRRLISNVTAPKQRSGSLALIGPSGSGKTSLLLKLATHDSFYGRHRPTVISIMPEDDSLPYQNPAELYRNFGIPVQNVRTEEEMEAALHRAANFEQILIDTPPLPLGHGAVQSAAQRLNRLLRPLLPLQVQFVLSATRTLDDFDPDFFKRLPIRPDAVALTHLDESTRWGRLAEWLTMINRPIQFVSTGPRVPNGIESFSPTWYIEELMGL